MDFWFPLSKTMIEECAEFTRLAPSEKVFWLSLLSEMNLRDGFYRADLEWGVKLALSMSMVRKARRKFQHRGWLTVTPGRYFGSRKLATSYHFARWARPETGTFFAPLCRYTWDELLWLLRADRLNCRDLVLYAFLTYYWHKFGGNENGGVYLSKRQIRAATNLSTVRDSFTRIRSQKQSCYYDHARLIEFSESHHRLHITKLADYGNSGPSGYAASRNEETERALKRAIALERARQHRLERMRKK